MEILARVTNRHDRHDVLVSTNGSTRTLAVAPKASGSGSSVNGGELLALALATCYCNDLYREAAARDIRIQGVEVEVRALFGAPGEPARQLRYRTTIAADAPEAVVRELAEHTDQVAEVQNTLRLGIPVELESVVVLASLSGSPHA